MVVKLSALLAIVFCTFGVAADEFVCGTGPAAQARAEALARLVKSRDAGGAAATAQRTRVLEDFLLVPVDEQTAPFDDPADLHGVSLHFTRRGAHAYTVARIPLAYDDARGELWESFGRGVTSRDYALTKFAFPFGDAQRAQVTLSVVRGIHFQSKIEASDKNVAAIDQLLSSDPLIAPLLDYLGSPTPRPEVYLKETAEALTVTWRPQSKGSVDFDIQAVLFANGDIRFNYKVVDLMAWGGVVVNSGSRAWLDQREGWSAAVPAACDGRRDAGGPAGRRPARQKPTPLHRSGDRW